MVRTWIALAILVVAACGSGPEPSSVIGYEREHAGCSEPRACLEDGTSQREVSGVRLIHKLTPGNPWIAVRVMVANGDRSEESALARAMVMQSITWWGSSELIHTWHAQVASLGARVYARSGLDYSAVSLIMPAKDVDRGFQLLGAAINHPASDALGVDRYHAFRDSYGKLLDAAADSAEAAASDAGWKLFAQGHAYLLHPERLWNVELPDVATAQDVLARDASMTTTVVGDLSLGGAITRVASTFGTPRSPRQPNELQAFVPYPDARVKFVERLDAPATYLYAYFAAPAPSDPDYAPLELGLRVLSSRLFDSLRTQRGLVYTVSATQSNYRNNFGSVSLSTRELPQATAAFRETLQQLVSDGIEDAELEGERAQYLTEFYEQTHSLESLSWMLGDWQMTSGDWHLAATLLEQIDAVDATAARDAVERYVHDLRYGVAGPTKYSSEEVTGTPAPPCEVTPTMCGCPRAEPALEVCNGKDDDCDGQVDEFLASPEICNGRDDDCDGLVDENKLSKELCNGRDDDCDGRIDEANDSCSCVRDESCDHQDNDCDGRVDEGQTAACGLCLDELTFANCPGHTVFISSTAFGPSFGNVAGADAECQKLATNAGRTGTWRAMIGDSNAQFDQRIHVMRPVYNTAQQLVAITADELFSGSIRAEIVTDQIGRSQPAGLLAWIGAPGADCVGWTSTSPNDLGSLSHVHKGTGWAGNRKDLPCNSIAMLFCIDQ